MDRTHIRIVTRCFTQHPYDLLTEIFTFVFFLASQELRVKLDALKVHPKDFQALLLSAEIGFQEITHIRATRKKGDFKKRPIYVC